MRIVLDDQPQEVTAASVGEAISACAAEAERRGRLVVDVLVDGRRLDESELARATTLDARAEEVALSTADPRDLVEDVIGQSIETLATIDGIQQEAAENIQADRPEPALAKLGEALELWHAVRQAVSLTVEVLDVDLDAVEAGGMPAPEIVERLNEQLRTLRDALAASDPVGLSDTLLYELPDVVRLWQDLLSALHDRLPRVER